MAALDEQTSEGQAAERLRAENAELRERLDEAERHTAQTLARATRLSQVIAVLGRDADFDSVVERAAVEVAELFSADIALLMLGPDLELEVEGQWGVRPTDVPVQPFTISGLEHLTQADPVATGPADSLPLPEWLGRYGACHVAWARLLVADASLGFMALVRRGPEPFERSDSRELRAVAYRISLALENSLLHRRMRRQIDRQAKLQARTTRLAGMLELEPVAQVVADMVVDDVPGVRASVVLIDREGQLDAIARGGAEDVPEGPTWQRYPLDNGGRPIGSVAIADPPPPASEEHELLTHLLGIAALALNKALFYERSREQARRDSLTGLLGHRAFQEALEGLSVGTNRFSVALLDIDDFKQVNDRYGHQTGDDALRLVADALEHAVRDGDSVFRIGGEEFCVILPGLGHVDAFAVAERLRMDVADYASAFPLTVSVGVASYPSHALHRDELLSSADEALYASKRAGKNRTTVAGSAERDAVA
jgi:diguanylate cyclase (GGDEF)-like protein